MSIKAALTIDVEPPFAKNQVLKLLDVLGQYRIKATFFVTGMVLEQHKDLASSLVKAGHELALHGYNHRTWDGESIERKKDAIRAIEAFKHVTGEYPLGFRAPYGNIDRNILHALEQNGVEYDSSVIPTLLRVEYGKITIQPTSFLKVPGVPYHPSNENVAVKGNMQIVEIPFSILPILNLPIGFGYALFFGLSFYKFFMRFFKEDLMIVYLHPYQLCNTLMSVGVPSIVKPYYGNRVDPLPVFNEFLEFIATYFSPEFLLMREIAKAT